MRVQVDQSLHQAVIDVGRVARKTVDRGVVQYNDEFLIRYDDTEDALIGLSGLLLRVVRMLESQRCKVTVTRENAHKFKYQPPANTTLRADQQQALDLICSVPGGFVIDAPTGWGKSHLVCELVEGLPQTRIAIAAPGTELLESLLQRLRGKVRELGVVGGGRSTISRVTVCTMESLQKLRGYEWELFLADEAHRFAAPITSGIVPLVFPLAKCVGLTATPTGRTDGSDLVTEGLFGPVILSVGYQDSVSRGDVVQIHTFVYHVDKGPVIGSLADTYVVNSVGIWRNDLRNDLVARIAKTMPDDAQVLITVATAEHALELRKRLPGYEVVFSSVTSKASKRKLASGEYATVKGLRRTKTGYTMLEGRRNALRVAFERGDLKKAIATGVWDTGVDFQGLNVLIRADGTASTIKSTQTPGRLSRTKGGTKKCGFLIDFNDAFDPRLRGRSVRRIREYKKHGWEVEFVKDPAVSD